jgi:hypothetical protein
VSVVGCGELTMAFKGRSEIRGEGGEVSVVVENSPTTDDLGKRYGPFDGWR